MPAVANELVVVPDGTALATSPLFTRLAISASKCEFGVTDGGFETGSISGVGFGTVIIRLKSGAAVDI